LKNQVGLWIDHRESIVVIVTGEGEETKKITSDMEKHVRFPVGHRQVPKRISETTNSPGHLNKYYDKVITSIGDAESILIFGPGEAKGELEKTA